MRKEPNIKVNRSTIRLIWSACVVLLILLFSMPQTSYAQEGTGQKNRSEKLNKKANKGKKQLRGDKPVSNKRQKRLSANKGRTKQGERAHQGDITGRKIKPKVSPRPTSPASRAVSNPYAGKPRRTEASAAKQAAQRRVVAPVSASRSGERAFKGSISGGKLRTSSASSARNKVYPKDKPQPYLGKNKKTEGDAAKKASKYARQAELTSRRSVSDKQKRIYPRPQAYAGVKNPTEGEKAKRASRNFKPPVSVSGKSKTLSGKPGQNRLNRSISGTLSTGSKSANPPRSISGRATSGGKITGGTRSISGMANNGGKAAGTRSISGNYIGRPKSPYGGGTGRRVPLWEKARKGDITGRKLRNKNGMSERPGVSKNQFNPYFGRKGGEKAYSGNIRPGVQSKSASGESRPGSRANMNNRSISGQYAGAKKPAFNPYFGRKKAGDRPYLGKIKANVNSISGSPEDNPGKRSSARANSISGQFSGGEKLAVNPYFRRGKLGDKPYTGSVKARANSITKSAESKPGKNNFSGAGSITGKYSGAKKPGYDPYFGRKKRGDVAYSGKITAKRNSMTGQMGDKNTPIPKAPRSDQSMRVSSFSGNMKAKKPGEGGGSLARNNWNNKATPTTVKIRSSNAEKSSQYAGNLKGGKASKGGGTVNRNNWNNEAVSTTVKLRSKNAEMSSAYSGGLKAKKPVHGGGSMNRNNWNNEATSTTVKLRSSDAEKASAFSGNLRASKPLKGGGSLHREQWNNEATPLKKIKQSPQIYYATKFKGDRKSKDLIPEKDTSYENYKGNIKLFNMNSGFNDDYINYSGSVKVVRKKGQGYHPDFYFHREEINSLQEKDKKFSVKVMIGKFFRSNQPSNLRKKSDKLEFDKKEQGLWYE